MRTKTIAAIAVFLITTGIFAAINNERAAHNIPSDLRDAVGDARNENFPVNFKDYHNNTDLPPIPLPEPPKPQERAVKTGAVKNEPAARNIKAWTIMVYINGKSNIEEDAVAATNLMETADSNDNVNLVVELGRMTGRKEDGKVWNGSRRYLITKDQDMENIASPVLMEINNVDMGDYRRIADFVSWSKWKFPANRYMLIIWNHGSGWVDPDWTGPDKAISSDKIGVLSPGGSNWTMPDKAISFDYETRNFVKTADLSNLMKSIGAVDVLAFDACLMQMAEVAYQVRSYADVIIASEEITYRYGFYYKGFLDSLAANPYATPEQLGAYIVDSYLKYYSANYQYPVTLSALKASALSGLPARLDAWVDAAIAANETEMLKTARDKVLRFSFGSGGRTTYADLYHFLKLVSSGTKSQPLRRASRNLMEYITGSIILRNGSFGTNDYGGNYRNAHGLAIDIPQANWEPSSSNNYGDLAFASDTKWPEFCKWMKAAVK